FELILGHVDAVALQANFVLEGGPRHWEILFAHAEESAERHDCVSNFAADLIDHYSLHGPDLLSVPPVYCGSFDLVASNQCGSPSSYIYCDHFYSPFSGGLGKSYPLGTLDALGRSFHSGLALAPKTLAGRRCP